MNMSIGKGCKGFSLIELIVVIAIVAILSAAAVPAIKTEIIKAKLINVINIANTLIDRSIVYSATHGRFGSAYDLGLGTASFNQPFYGPVDSSHETQIFGPYYASGYFNGTVLGENYSAQACGAGGIFYFHINPQSVGLPSNVATQFTAYCVYWHTATNEFKRSCGYSYGTGVSLTDDLLAGTGWVNINNTSGWDYSNFPSDNGESVCQ